MAKVIVLDNLAQEGLDVLNAADGIEVTVQTGLKGDELKQVLLDFDGAICRSGVKLGTEALTGNRRLKAIVRAGVGTDNIDKQVATRHGIIVMNTPTGNTISTAEHAFALMMSMSRNIAQAHQSLREGRWDRKAYMGSQLADKTLGIVGLGRIGREIASRAQAFQMRVIGFDPFLTDEKASELGIERVIEVRDMLPRVDFLTVHTPLTPETKGLIGDDAIEIIKPGARLINCARGGIYDEAAILRGLESGKLAGVALDVYESEPCTDSPIFSHPNAVCTPHLGASTEEAQTQVAVEAANLLINFLSSGEIRHAVNTVAIDPNTLMAMRGHLNLTHRLGILLSEWHTGNVTKCKLTIRGEVAKQDSRLLTSAFCAGLIGRMMDEEVNIVNAEVLLRDRGIEVTTVSESDHGAFSSSVLAQVDTDADKSFSAAGTLFGNEMPRLIMLGHHRLEAYLDGTMLMFTHKDVPGIIGSVGTICGKHNVNIGQMSVGRAEAGNAVGVLNLDSVPPQEALDEISGISNIVDVVVTELPGRDELPTWLQ